MVRRFSLFAWAERARGRQARAEKAGEYCAASASVRAAKPHGKDTAQQHGSNMDDKLILAVFNFPELYNVTLPNYRCTQSRANAWKNISLTLGLPTASTARQDTTVRQPVARQWRRHRARKDGRVVFRSVPQWRRELVKAQAACRGGDRK
ncbi:hypothetical protein WMY93_020577 [Mugilogobius chulae]|uniref:MADF domain-containing protein n=1 Tax=Mugilogobius chulae TaxID=88201 RepID=A0AAW0N888_9GOBI